jgi:hypothetical protein
MMDDHDCGLLTPPDSSSTCSSSESNAALMLQPKKSNLKRTSTQAAEAEAAAAATTKKTVVLVNYQQEPIIDCDSAKSQRINLKRKRLSTESEGGKCVVAAALVPTTSSKKSKEKETTIATAIAATTNEDESHILSKLDIEYAKLNDARERVKRENVCAICESSDAELIECSGSGSTCQQWFHLDCVGILSGPYKCDECQTGMHTCFACKKPATAQMPTRKCHANTCGKYYHDECTRSNQLFRIDDSNAKKVTFICPQHTCNTCWSDRLHNNNNSDCGGGGGGGGSGMMLLSQSSQIPFKGRFFKCIRCPSAYHVGDFCIAAGSLVQAGPHIICPNHFVPITRFYHHQRVNVSWCFVCCETGPLIGCKNCPAAYHHECMINPPANLLALITKGDMTEPPPNPTTQSSSSLTSSTITNSETNETTPNLIITDWICDDCQINKRPVYGQIVWSKVSRYQWWPAQICHPRSLPDNVKDKQGQCGEFGVKFFGTNDFYWVHLGRTFVFAEGDAAAHTPISGKLNAAHKRGVDEAVVAFKAVQRLKAERAPTKVHSSKQSTLSAALSTFQYIRGNKPVGNAKIYRLPVNELPCCECDPKSAKPCGTNDCLNRALKYECHPALCRTGERCQNQRFTKRQYPKQEPLPCGGRGWGLRTAASSDVIKAGQFVNEYVGEIIDEEECKRRLKHATDNNISSFYFLTIDQNRVIDAGPKGNLARFMNHSCDPNVETQKWNVNGDIRIGLFALTDIPGDTELTFNYNLDCLSNERAICRCGSKKCTGFIGDRPKGGGGESNVAKTAAKNRRLSMGGNGAQPQPQQPQMPPPPAPPAKITKKTANKSIA